MSGETHYATVSFYKVALLEIGPLANRIVEAGWEPVDGKGEPWAILVGKTFSEPTPDPEAELREIMGDYWMTGEEIGGYTAPGGEAA